MKPIIAIQEGEEVHIPKKYHRINDLCAIIYDQLTEIYIDDNYEGLSETSIELDNAKKKIRSLEQEGTHILDWLKENDRNDELEIILTKHLFMAITSDFINFIFESLHTAKRGKITVAYSLIRKPITDLLNLLEQILVNRKDFIQRFFYDGEPKGYDPSARNLDRHEIIKKALDKIRINELFDPAYIHELRYDKESEFGFNALTNRALHIVTNDKRYKTGNQNLNFVFSDEEDRELNYDHYYNFVPYLLIYSASVIDGIVFEILKDSDNQKLQIVKEFRRLIALLVLPEYTNSVSKKSNNEIFQAISDELKIECDNCGKINSIERADCDLFLETEILLCSNCADHLLNSDEAILAIDRLLIPN